MVGLPGYIHSDRGSAFMSAELRGFLSLRGIASSRTTAYNPAGNGQVERENQTIWKAITLALKTKGLPIAKWQDVLPEVLHATRSLLCTATNSTPHDRLFSFPRKCTTGVSLPDWLTRPGPVWLKRHVRGHKTDPIVESVDLLHANPEYAFVRHPDGRENTVSLRDLAPTPDSARVQPPETVGVPDATLHAAPPPNPAIDVQHDPLTVNQSTIQRPGDVSTHPAQAPTPAKYPGPLMGRAGGKWCKIDEENILQGSRRSQK